jgi:P4 family phage/plasmid primase-like protien
VPIIDLRTGRARASRPEDYCTKAAPVVAGGECPMWLAFLDRVMAGDRELVAYLKRACGYCLTGLTTEHVLFFLYGTGSNGKSVFVTTVTGMMGDYAVSAPAEIFMASPTDRHPTELARLRGVRLVVASEVEVGRRWAESRIKQLTGGDRISARFMRMDFFEYVPQFKLMITGNHKPRISRVDEAIRRRIHLVPFTVTIPPAERDPDLAARLKTEWPGILAWAVEGCLEWRRVGLSPPEAVRKATDDYLATEDTIGQWLEECCIENQNGFAKSADLFASWKAWAERSGEPVGSAKALSQELAKRGFEKGTAGHAKDRGFRGLTVRAAERPAQGEGQDRWDH